MILSKSLLEYFRSMQSKAIQAMAASNAKTPYQLPEDENILRYEAIRDVWINHKSVSKVCKERKIQRPYYYDFEKKFVEFGVVGLLNTFAHVKQFSKLEQIIVMARRSRPTLSNAALLRIAQALPMTSSEATIELVSEILSSHGLNPSSLSTDMEFFGKIQRILTACEYLKTHPVGKRNTEKRKETFYVDEDQCHKKWELLRELYHNPLAKPKVLCMEYGISLTSYYRLIEDYKWYGPWAIVSAPSFGKSASIAEETELNIILEKLRHPQWTGQQIVDALNLKCTRSIINRVLKTWGLMVENLKPVALDEYIVEEDVVSQFQPTKSAYHIISEQDLLDGRRINKNFEDVCKKMNTNSYHICDPGPILLAPFLNDLGIVQAFEIYGPVRLRGKEMTNLPLLNMMRVLGGYERINHLSNNRDRAVAFASGLGMFGTRSRYYDEAMEFKFDNLHKMRCDLVARAFELGIISGKSIGFDFHFKEFYGCSAKEKGIGHGPDKSGQLVPGFRPHIAWDLAENVIITIAYYQGATRSSRILKNFCERDLFIVLDQLRVEEMYMDSEYTKEADFYYLKTTCKNGDIYVCLKQNPQIKKLIKPALDSNMGWEKHNESDERCTIEVTLPKTGLKMKVVILRNASTKEDIRCFGTTNLMQMGKDILRKYPHRWTIENGIKDLIHSYFLDHILGHDPEKVEFDFYCMMAARLVYEYFLKKLGGSCHKNVDGNKTTLSTMRQLLFEKRNCTIRQDSHHNLVLTFLDSGEPIELEVAELYKQLTVAGKNKVLWWNNRGLALEFQNQYKVFG